MLTDQLHKFSDACESVAQAARALASAMQSDIAATPQELRHDRSDVASGTSIGLVEPGFAPTDLRATPERRGRREDSLPRLVDFGYLSEGDKIRLVPSKIPTGASPDDPRFSARIDRNPAKPIWGYSGSPVKSLSELSKHLRDEHGVPLPRSNFNPCKYWYIDGQPTWRTIARIAEEIVL